MSVSTVVISKSGSLQTQSFGENNDIPSLLAHLNHVIKNRGCGPLKVIGAYPSHNTLLIGSTSGKHSQINRHEFAPPYDADLFYGDVIMVKLNTSDSITFSSMEVSEYDDMYETLMDGFESLGSTDTDDDLEENDDDGEQDPDYVPGQDKDAHEDDETVSEYSQSEEEEEWDFDQDYSD